MSESFEVSASDEVFVTNEVYKDVDDTVEEVSSTKNVDSVDAPKKIKQAIGPVADGVFGTTKADKVQKKSVSNKSKKPKSETTVALHSTKNVFWPEVGKISYGYNIVEKDVADKWLTRSHIRIATPEELVREFGVK
jgi:hypothetical protein